MAKEHHLWRYVRREQAAISMILDPHPPPLTPPGTAEMLYETPSLTLATLPDLASLNNAVKIDSGPVIKAHPHYQHSNYN